MNQSRVRGSIEVVQHGARRITLRSDVGSLEVEGADVRVVVAVLQALVQPRTPSAIARRTGLPRAAVDAAVELLRARGFVVEHPRLASLIHSMPADLTLSRLRSLTSDAGIQVDIERNIARRRGPARTRNSYSSVVHGPFSFRDADAWLSAERERRGPALVIVDLHGRLVAGGGPDGSGCVRCAVLRRLAREDQGWPRRAANERKAKHAVLRSDVGRVLASVLRMWHAGPPHPRAAYATSSIAEARQAGQFEWRPVLRHPECPWCASRSIRVAPTVRDVPVAGPAAAALTDDAFGPMMTAEIATGGAHRFRGLPLVWGGVAALVRGTSKTTGFNGTVGTGFSAEQRRLVVLYEGIERYALRTRTADCRGRSYASLGARALDPTKLPLYSDAQYDAPGFPIARFEPHRPMHWVASKHLTRGYDLLLPWECVAVAIEAREYRNRVLETLTSSGAAAHRTHDLAIFGALRELIERDAWLATWFKQLVPPRITLRAPTGDDELDELVHFLGRHLDLRLYDIRVDFQMPTILAVGCSRDARGALAPDSRIVTVSGGSTAQEAARRALMELCLHWEAFALSRSKHNDWASITHESNAGSGFHDIASATLWTLDPAFSRRFGFLDATSRTIDLDAIQPWPPPAQATAAIGAALDERGLDCFVVDITPPDLAFLDAVAVRVVIPGLIPLEVTSWSRRLPLCRLEQLASRSGHALQPAGEINHGPHPVV